MENVKVKRTRNSPLKALTLEERRVRRNAQYKASYHKRRESECAKSLARYNAAMAVKPWFGILRGCLNRARARGLPFDTDMKNWAAERWTGHCELTGVKFVFSRGRGCGPSPLSPSIDRIEPALGYTKANCRFIAHGLNGLKGSGTDDDAWALAKAWVLTEIGKGMTPPVSRESLEGFFPTPRDRS